MRPDAPSFTRRVLLRLKSYWPGRGSAASSVPKESLPAYWGLTRIDPARPVFVFFTPAGIAPYVTAHAIVARTLQERGHQVLMVACSGQYAHCIFYDMCAFSTDISAAQRQEACAACRAPRDRAFADYGLPTIDLGQLVAPETLVEIRTSVASMPFDTSQFSVDGIPFAQLCGADLALNLKCVEQVKVTGAARARLEAYTQGALVSYHGLQAMLKCLNVARVLYFNEYAMHLGGVLAARKAGVPVTRISYAIHKNVDLTKIILLHEPMAIMTYHRAMDEWPAWRELALPSEVLEAITQSGLMRIGPGGYTVYSPHHSGASDTIYELLGLSRDRKLLVAYTSSIDEYFSNVIMLAAFGMDLFQKEQPFQDQIEWLTALIDHIERSDHLQLVIRIHPREDSNHREAQRSDHLALLRERFSGAYRHVRIIWPQDPISSYDLAEMADVALTAWTNLTLELARLGVPIVMAFKRYMPCPIDDVVAWSPTPAAYFETIERLLAEDAGLNRVRYAYRWSHVHSLSMSVDFDDVVPAGSNGSLPPFVQTRNANLVEDIIVGGQRTPDVNRAMLVRRQADLGPDEEMASLQRQLRRVIWFLVTGEVRADDYRLSYSPDPSPGSDLAISDDGDAVIIDVGGRRTYRRSPMVKRLARLAHNADLEPTILAFDDRLEVHQP